MNEIEYYKNGPSEWNYKKLGDVVTFQGGSQPAKKYFSNDKSAGMIRLIQIRDYKNDNFITYVPKELCRRFCDVDDIMIGRYGPPIFQILRGIEGAYNVALIKAIPNEEIINKNYLYYFIKNEHLFKLIDGLSQRTSGQTGIDMDVLKKYIIPIPNLTEQEKIAEILSTVDEQIKNTEKLIQKNQELKKGLMQQLLTKGIGHTEFKKTELGDIPKAWEIKKIEEICEILDSKRVPLNGKQRLKMQGDIPYYGANAIVDYINDYIFDDELILIAEDGGNFGEFREKPIAFYVKGKCWVNNHAHVLKAVECENSKWIFYNLVHKDITEIVQGGTRAKLNQKDLRNIKIPFPNLDEQEKIALILSSMDKKIEQYKYKKEKLEELKKGLMKQLLNGNIRVI